MKAVTKLFACIFALVLLSTTASAASASGNLSSHLQKLKNVTAKFEQRVIGTDSKLLEQSTGILYLKKPGKFKWVYDDQQQLIVSDGSKIYFQMNDLEQVIVRDLQVAIASVPSLILVSDLSKLDELFSVSQNKAAGNVDLFELKPKLPQSTYSSILLSFVDGNLIGLRIIDGLGQSTEVTMQSAIDYSILDSSEFEFSIPKNFDIVEG